MSKLLSLSAVPVDKVHPFGTLAVIPAIKDNELGTAARHGKPFVLQHDNGFYYLITPAVADALCKLVNTLTHTHGVVVTSEVYKRGTGMVWTKGSQSPHAYITAGVDGKMAEVRVSAAALTFEV
ncbi:hypothetical protein pEaSNUABM37_00034 [Erwinia phage pEa_SNUABM_37]|nr:hypothetical protein pEaSNUABM37_00034 [Erwinia phage pEa_SNUABM_37]QXO10504.1 hypothetical protein pEaSNUABM48_00034 [Erwinia phage pEa_SNUABM_48]